MWDSLLDAIGALLAFFYGLVPNYGMAIILLTVAIRLALYPLTAKQARSMAAMQRVQPEIKKIQQQYKHDRQKLNEELMAFYKEHKINPLSGCLPLVAQIPVFIALFQVLRSSSASHIPEGSRLFEAFCPEGMAVCAEQGARGLGFLGMDLSVAPAGSHESLFAALPFWILVLVVVGSGFWQSRQMARLQKGRPNPQTQMMTKVFPFVFGIISINLPAGVVLYFLVSNLWQIGQQAVVFGRGDSDTPSRGRRAPEQADKGGGKGGSGDEAGKKSGNEAGKKSGNEAGKKSGDEAGTARDEGAGVASDGDQGGARGGANEKDDGSGERAKQASSTGSRPNRSKSRKRKKRKKRR